MLPAESSVGRASLLCFGMCAINLPEKAAEGREKVMFFLKFPLTVDYEGKNVIYFRKQKWEVFAFYRKAKEI